MEFCMRIANHILLKEVEESKDKNLVLSPLSINVVLNMVAAGSTGHALEHMLGLLGFKSITDLNSNSSEIMDLAADARNGGPVLTMVNGVWADKRFPLKPYHEEVLVDIFNCESKIVDFQTQAEELIHEINSWAKKASRGLIPSILGPGSLTSLTVLVLANALYFKGVWSDKFDAKRTQNRDFYLLNGDTISVPFMTSREDYQFGSFHDFKALKIPYQTRKSTDTQFSMYFFLPNKLDGLPSLLEKLYSDSGFVNLLHLKEVKLDKFWIPKFKFSYDFDVCKAMKEMGISLNVANSEVLVSNILHKAFVEIDEEGTEAAAVTVSRLIGCSMYTPEKKSFVADHPFVFMIKEEVSGLVFFTGAVLNPVV